MPSRAELRKPLETALRVAIVASLAFALWKSIAPVNAGDRTIRSTSQALNVGIERALTHPGDAAIELAMTTTPSPLQRDQLVALRRTGMSVRWSGEVSPLAVEVIRDRDPLEGAQIRVVGAKGAVVLRDSAGVLDTLREGTSTLGVGALVGSVQASDAHTSAIAAIPAATPRRAVLVLGRADWESKFVMSALNESGWLVRARIPSAPNVDVHDDGILPIDTSRYDAVIALDTTAADYATAIVRFVEQGGGLVVSGGALGVGALRAIAPATASARIPGRILLAEDTVTRRDLPFTPLGSVRTDAVSLERQPAGTAIAARRVENGRVLALAYDESWRWRMLGGNSGLSAHRDWWSHLVASVSAERADPVAAGISAVPRVALVNALGPSSALTSAGQNPIDNRLPLWLLVLPIAAALVEIASRRFRGER